MTAQIKERPILFSGAMVRALLDGSKTLTRRVVKPDPGPYWNPQVGPYNPLVIKSGGYEAPGPEIYGASDENQGRECPYGQPGDRLWVREAWLPDPEDDGTWSYTQWSGCKGSPLSDIPKKFQKPEHCIHRASWTGSDLVWRASIHMPRWASRILLEIVSVRVEQLQDISQPDAGAEGIQEWARGACAAGNPLGLTNVGYFSKLWEQTYGPGSWDANPWVWVVEFAQVTGESA